MSAREAVRAREGGRALVSPALRDRLERLSNRAIGIEVGRLGVVVAAAVVFGSSVPTVLLVASIFFVCLQHSFAGIHVAMGSTAAAVTGALTGLLATLLLALSLPSLRLDSLALLGTALGVCLALPPVDHVLRKLVVGRRVLVVGSPESADYLSEELLRRRTRAFDGVSVLIEPSLGEDLIAGAVYVPAPDLVLFTLRSRASGSRNGDTIGLADFFEHALGRVPPRCVAPDWFSDLPQLRRRSASAISKRAFDIIVALLGVLLTAPVWPIVVIATVRTRGAFFFHQLRVGEDGNAFTMYKFRTMRLDAEPEGKAVWAQVSDPRIRFGGRFLRETHLDELPQLWNVLKGDMSIVGPRPERPELVPMLEEAIPHWARRQRVKPGITGWAQVRQGYAGDCDGCEEKLSYDLWYLRHRTLLLDLAICLWTFPSLVLRALAHSRALPR